MSDSNSYSLVFTEFNEIIKYIRIKYNNDFSDKEKRQVLINSIINYVNKL